jgi:hypothetical protein
LNRILASLAGAFALFVGTAELAVRALDPYPRVQILRDHGPPKYPVLYAFDGVPMWRSDDPVIRTYREPACLSDPSRTVLLIVGDSVVFVSGDRKFAGNLGPALQEVMGDRWCVVNAAHSGYSAAQKLGALRESLTRLKPDVVLWEVWAEGPTLSYVGPHIYALGSTRKDDDGYPAVPVVPGALHHPLFRWSRAWEYLTLTSVAGNGDEDVLQYHFEALRLSRDHRFTLVFGAFPSLAKPFEDDDRYVPAAQREVVDWADREGLQVVDVRGLLRDQDVEALRVDPCCHYNQQGHAVIAERLGPILLNAAAPE